jgi:hypothetical protein
VKISGNETLRLSYDLTGLHFITGRNYRLRRVSRVIRKKDEDLLG